MGKEFRLVSEGSKIERDYSEIELSQTQDSKLKDLSKQRATLFLKKLINEVEMQIDNYLEKYPTDDEIEKEWEEVEDLLVTTPLTKKRVQVLRKFWKKLKNDRNWKVLVVDLKEFLSGKGAIKKKPLKPFDKSKLKLITLDFIS